MYKALLLEAEREADARRRQRNHNDTHLCGGSSGLQARRALTAKLLRAQRAHEAAYSISRPPRGLDIAP